VAVESGQPVTASGNCRAFKAGYGTPACAGRAAGVLTPLPS